MRSTTVISAALAIAITLLASGCHSDTPAGTPADELARAEACMYEHPDSALRLLQAIPSPSTLRAGEQATLALLTTQAKYKLYIDQSDSLINVAYAYFMRKKDDRRKAMTLYYKAALLYEDHAVEEAQNYYLQAVEAVQKCDDYRLAHLVYAGLGTLYAYGLLYDYALDCYLKAYDYALKGGDYRYIVSSYGYLAKIYSVQGDLDEAIRRYGQGISLAKEKHDYKLLVALMSELASVYNKKEAYTTALGYLKQCLELQIDNDIREEGGTRNTLGRTYSKLNLADSARMVLQENLTSTNCFYRLGANQQLAYLARDRGDYKEAFDYLDVAWYINDSVKDSQREHTLITMQEKYNRQQAESKAEKLKMEKERITRRTLVGVVVLLMVIIVLVYIYQRRLLGKEQELVEKERAIRVLEERIHAKALQVQAGDTSLKGPSPSTERMESLSQENQRLHHRESFLINQLIERTGLLKALAEEPEFINADGWKPVMEQVDFLFDNYTIRLAELIPSLTDNDLQLCCLIKLRLSNTAIGNCLGISPSSVTKRKTRLKERILQAVGSFEGCRTLDAWLWNF